MVSSLFLLGILVFVINNSVLFIVVDRNVYRIPRVIMRFITSLTWLIAAAMGTLLDRPHFPDHLHNENHRDTQIPIHSIRCMHDPGGGIDDMVYKGSDSP